MADTSFAQVPHAGLLRPCYRRKPPHPELACIYVPCLASRRVDDGLVQMESPFKGTKRFGMVYSDKSGNLASVGTVLEIKEHATVQVGHRHCCTAVLWHAEAVRLRSECGKACPILPRTIIL